jgi:outer membrane protein OmpA-like peptidoglycan-associated protein
VVLRNIFFDLDKSELKEQSIPELQELAAFLEKNPKVKVEISGHTDNQGEDAYNLELSQRRADAVKEYLTTKAGIEQKRIQTKGYGATNPIAPNETEEGRAKNRRTEFKIVATD